MSLSQSTLSAIQQAGQSLHQATVVVSTAVREQAEHMVSTVANQPYQPESEQAFTNFKMLAALSQELQSLEQQLRTLYAKASELASPEMDVVVALAHSSRARAATAEQNAMAEDAVVKPAPSRRTPVRKGSKARASTTGGAAQASPAHPVRLTANDSKVLDYLKTVLQTDGWTALTGAAVSVGAGMPLGSVGISLKKVVLCGAVRKRGKGSYQLAA